MEDFPPYDDEDMEDHPSLYTNAVQKYNDDFERFVEEGDAPVELNHHHNNNYRFKEDHVPERPT
jgi:hypothetical protein